VDHPDPAQESSERIDPEMATAARPLLTLWPMSATMKFAGVLASTAVLLAAAGCGSDSKSDSSTTSTAAEAADTSASDSTGGTTVTSTGDTMTVSTGASADGESYDIYLSNNFLGNDWRQQMVKTAEEVVKLAPLQGRVNLTIVNTDNDPTKQTQSLNQMILEEPDAILVDASSPNALNSVITRACDAGITVVTFDQLATADCAYKVSTDLEGDARIGAEWLAKTLDGSGKVLLDQGLAGAPVSLTIVEAVEDVLAGYPDIEVVGKYESQYALAPEQQAAASLVAAHPQIDGVFSQSYGTGVQAALRDAGRATVPMVTQGFNGSFVECATDADATCMISTNPPLLVAEAMKLAVDLLDGGQAPSKDIKVPMPVFSNNDVTVDGVTFTPIEIGTNAFPDLPLGGTFPVSPEWTSITPEQVLQG
jgi:ribose transport system substrate-binding protein